MITDTCYYWYENKIFALRLRAMTYIYLKDEREQSDSDEGKHGVAGQNDGREDGVESV